MYDRDNETERTFQPEELSEFEAYLYASQGKVPVRTEVPQQEKPKARGRKARPSQRVYVNLLSTPGHKARMRASR